MLVARLVAAAALTVALTPTGSAQEPAGPSPQRANSSAQVATDTPLPLDLGSSVVAGSALAGDGPAPQSTTYDGCNWMTCKGSTCTSTLRACETFLGPITADLPVVIEARPAPAKPEAKPHLRTQPLAGFWITKSVTIPEAGGWSAKSDYFGGRFHGRIPTAWGGRVALVLRGDIVALPGSNPFKDLGAAKALEGYGGAEVVVLSRGRLDVALGAVAGETFPFSDEVGQARPASESLAAGGLLVHDYRSGAWGAVLVGRYDAAGGGTRVIASAHLPIKAGFAFLVDYVSGSGGWLRPGVAYGVAW